MTPIDEALIGGGEKIRESLEDSRQAYLQTLATARPGFMRPFIDSVKDLDQLHNRPVALVMGDDSIYVLPIEEAVAQLYRLESFIFDDCPCTRPPQEVPMQYEEFCSALSLAITKANSYTDRGWTIAIYTGSQNPFVTYRKVDVASAQSIMHDIKRAGNHYFLVQERPEKTSIIPISSIVSIQVWR